MSARRPLRGIGVATWWRQVRSDIRPNLVIAVIVFATALVVAIAPRVVEHASRLDLSDAVENATPEQRNLSFESRREVGAGAPSDPFFNIDVLANDLREGHIPPGVSPLLRGEQWIFDTPEFVVSSFPDQVEGPFPTTIRLRYQQGIEDHTRLVEGAMPTAQDGILRLEGTECPEDVDDMDALEMEAFEPLEDQDCGLVELPLFEVAITQQTADDMMVEVGDQVTLLPSLTDLSFRSALVNVQALRFVLRVSGIIELDDESLEYWYADSSLHRPRVTENPDFRFVFAVGLMSPDQYRPFRNAASGVSLNFAWRFLVDPELVDQADAAELSAELEKIAPPNIDMVTQLPELLNDHLAQRRLTVQLLSMAAVAFTAGAFASIWTVALVDAERRRRVTALIVDRGASRIQLVANAIRTAVLVVFPAAVAGAIVASLSVSGSSMWPTVAPVGVVAAVTLLLMVAAHVPRGGARDLEGSRLRRVVVELLVVGLAVGAVVLLRRRATGVEGALSEGFDATLAVAPFLTALAVGIVSQRLVGPVGSLLAILADRARGASWMIGVRRVVDQPRALRAPTLAIAVVATVAVFAAVVFASVLKAQEVASWLRVGGEHRIETINPDLPLPGHLQSTISSIDDGAAFATTLRFRRFEVESSGFVADVVALDLEEFVSLVEGSVLEAPVNSALDGIVDAQHDSEVIPALFIGSSSLQSERLGTAATLQSGGFSVEMTFRGVADRFAGLPTGRQTVLVDRATFGAATSERTIAPTLALMGDGGEVDTVREVIKEQGVVASVTSRSDRLAAIAGDPLSTWTTRALRSLALAALIFGVITAAAAAIITASMRERDLGVLAILGHERRSLGRLVTIELLPGIAVAGVLGAIAGAGVAWLLSTNLSLGAFAGGAASPGVTLDWQPIALVVGALGLTVALTVLVTVRSLRRLDHAMLLRRGET